MISKASEIGRLIPVVVLLLGGAGVFVVSVVAAFPPGIIVLLIATGGANTSIRPATVLRISTDGETVEWANLWRKGSFAISDVCMIKGRRPYMAPVVLRFKLTDGSSRPFWFYPSRDLNHASLFSAILSPNPGMAVPADVRATADHTLGSGLLPATTRGRWRLTSPVWQVVDRVFTIGAVITILAGVGIDVATWPTSWWPASPNAIAVATVALFIVSWLWGVVTFVLSAPRRNEYPARPRLRWTPRAKWFVSAVVAVVAVDVVGVARGAAKGSLRTLPGGLHQISGQNPNVAWSTVPLQMYHDWGAELIRGDTLVMTFVGLWTLGLCLAVRRMRHRASGYPATER